VTLDKVTKRTVIVSKFKSLGWTGPFGGGDHPVMKKGTRKQKVPNPHGSGDVDVSLLRRILRQANISDDDWNSA
jgi:predicted RNA binding protein YcfA (HicA-like mRNA interferase family)